MHLPPIRGRSQDSTSINLNLFQLHLIGNSTQNQNLFLKLFLNFSVFPKTKVYKISEIFNGKNFSIRLKIISK